MLDFKLETPGSIPAWGELSPFFFCTKRKVLTIQNYQIIKLRLMKENIPRASILPENAAYNKWQFQALVTSNRTENQFHLNRTKKIGQSSKGI